MLANVGGAADELCHRRVHPARDNTADDRHQLAHFRGVSGPGQRRRGDPGNALGFFEQRRRHPARNVAGYPHAETRAGRKRQRHVAEHGEGAVSRAQTVNLKHTPSTRRISPA